MIRGHSMTIALTALHVAVSIFLIGVVLLQSGKGAEMGAKTKNGLEMLHLQAEKAWEIWNS